MKKTHHNIARRSITRHWLTNSLGAVTAILLIIEVLLIFLMRNYYYSSARQYLTSRMKIVTTAIMNTSGEEQTNYNSQIRSIVESYEDKDKIELMAINSKGRVVLTSSGFSPDADMVMPDYEEAMETGEGSYRGRLAGGEKILAVSVPIYANRLFPTHIADCISTSATPDSLRLTSFMNESSWQSP